MSEEFSFDVFLSHSSKDKTVVRTVAEQLRKDGLKVWFDEWMLKPGDNIPSKIEEGLEHSRVLVFCMSANAFGSDWAQLESYTFRFRDPLNKERRLIPLRLDNTPIKGSLAQFLYINWLPTPDGRQQEYVKLLETCRSPAKPTGSQTLGEQTAFNENTLIPASTIKMPSTSDVDFGIQTTTTLRDTLTILVPVYNESSAIMNLVKALKAEGLIEKYRVILCDDGSTDNSFEIMQQCSKGINSITCIRNRFNERKVGAIYKMAQIVNTPFLLTLDADCILAELEDNALETLMQKMIQESYTATCFRIIPHDTNWLGRLQKLDYLIFADSLRAILGVPVCLIGQGVLWRTDSFLDVLANHSGEFDGDDLENTIIALDKKMRIHWERETVLLYTNSKKTIIGLIRQRALSWDFGMLRVLFGKRALWLSGESGAFYKNLLLMEFFAHPFRLIAIPVLLSVPLIQIMGPDFYYSAAGAVYRQSLAASFKYGSLAIASIWTISIINSFICVRGRIVSTIKWAIFNVIYLSSPFVYVAYYRLVAITQINAFDILGSTIHWFGLGLILTYLWWTVLTFYLLMKSSVQRNAKVDMIWSVFLSPIYFFVLLVVCKTGGIIKYLLRVLVGR